MDLPYESEKKKVYRVAIYRLFGKENVLGAAVE